MAIPHRSRHAALIAALTSISAAAWYVLQPTAGVAPRAISQQDSSDVWQRGGRTPAASPNRLFAWKKFIAANFAGDQACAECHAAKYEAHQRSGHSHTAAPMADSALAAQLVAGGPYRDPLRDQTFAFEVDEGRFLVREQTNEELPAVAATWLLGSGTHAQTPVAVNESTQSGLEFRWSYLAHADTLGVTPDQQRFDEFRDGSVECYGRPMDAADVRSCLGCHTTTGPPPQLPIRNDLYVPNVGCERCHGPRKKHVILARQGRAAEAPPLLRYDDPNAYMDACSQCHRDEESISPDAAPHETVRFQPYGLKRSRCYLAAPEQMTCSACHDPHDAVHHDRAQYIEQCQRCHESETASRCRERPQGDCIECHMPAVQWTAGISFHDHWIRVRAGDEASRRTASDNGGYERP